MSSTPNYTIQHVSQQTDVSSSTLRYYEQEGLLLPVARAANGHRRYSEEDIRRVKLIKKLRLTGMSIEAMRTFLSLYQGGTGTARQRRRILETHRQAVQTRVEELVEMLTFIDYKIGLYHVEEADNEQYIHEVSTVREDRPLSF